MTGTVVEIPKLRSVPQKQTQTSLDTRALTRDEVEKWKHPPFQRPLKENEKVRDLATQIDADGGVIPGILTLGVLAGDVYIVDGQHRLHAFTLAKCQIAYADVRTHFFASMADMGAEFVRLNSSLVKLRPDDILRGLEGSLATLQRLRKKCPFIGYDMIRRNDRSPILSMSMVIRTWLGSYTEVPASSGVSAAQLAQTFLTESEVDQAIAFLSLAYEAWGRDTEYQRLWGALNLILCAWLYRRLVMGHDVSVKAERLTHDQFRKCLMALSADAQYLEWLVGRNRLNDHDRSPAFQRVKRLFVARLRSDGHANPKLPAPAWSLGHYAGRGR